MAEPRDTVRTLTGLTTDELDDDQIDQLLELNTDSVKLAAADALEAFASTLVDVESDDITLSGSKRATVLMTRAQRLRDQASQAATDDDFFFDVVPAYDCSTPELAPRSCW